MFILNAYWSVCLTCNIPELNDIKLYQYIFDNNERRQSFCCRLIRMHIYNLLYNYTVGPSDRFLGSIHDKIIQVKVK